MKNLFLSLVLLSLPMMACAEYPEAVVSQSVVDDQAGGGGEEVTSLALHLNGKCGEGPLVQFYEDTDIFLGQDSGDVLVRMVYTAADGDGVRDGRVQFFYKTASGNFSEDDSNGGSLVLAGMLTDEVVGVQNPNLLGPLLNSNDVDQYNSFISYYDMGLGASVTPDSFMTSLDSALNGGSVDFNFFQSISSVVVIDPGHNHFPNCVDVTWTGDVDEIVFEYGHDEDGGEHDHDGDHDHEDGHDDHDDHDHDHDHGHDDHNH